MPLSPGTQVGSYEIVSLLGAGGMGEVYRARDPRLKREVALKVLPDVAAADADRRERFTREALAVAALNHPHIVTIHSVEDAGTAVFLTMELVEGRSLAEALPATGLPIERVLTIGIAVADATSAAHQKGITHRDLKPGNIMLGEGEQAGRIKVLDFGLAKVVDAQRGAAGASMLPTEAPAHTAPITAEGRILGTVAYMSPEQAEGRTIDGRSDLFSLGVVLYEMATGQRPFAGDTQPLDPVVDPQGHAEVGHRHQPGDSPRARTHHPPRARQGSRAPISDGQGSAERSRGPESLTRFERITAITGNVQRCRIGDVSVRAIGLANSVVRHASRRRAGQTPLARIRRAPLPCCSLARRALSTGCCGPTRNRRRANSRSPISR